MRETAPILARKKLIGLRFRAGDDQTNREKRGKTCEMMKGLQPPRPNKTPKTPAQLLLVPSTPVLFKLVPLTPKPAPRHRLVNA